MARCIAHAAISRGVPVCSGKKLYGQASPVEWLTESNWASIWALKELDGFKLLPSDIEGSQKRWKVCHQANLAPGG